MLLKNTFLFKEIGEEGMLIPIVGGNVDASKIFNLNNCRRYNKLIGLIGIIRSKGSLFTEL